MEIFQAQEADVPHIVDRLELHYQELNEAAGYFFFNNNKELMAKPIKKRVTDEDSDFRYFVVYKGSGPLPDIEEEEEKSEEPLTDEQREELKQEIEEEAKERAKGFVATMLDGEKGEILMLLADTKKYAKDLLDKAIEYLKEEGDVHVILAEESTNHDIAALMKDKGFSSFTENLILQIKKPGEM